MERKKAIGTILLTALILATFIGLVKAEGGSPADPIMAPIGGGTYTGTLPKGSNYGDCYNVTGYLNHSISVTLYTDDSNWLMWLYGPGSPNPLNPPGIGFDNFTYHVTIPGNYCIEVYRNDPSSGNYTIKIDSLNLLPYVPSFLSSPPSPRYVYTSYDFTVSTVDPESDNVSYKLDWGDNTTTTTGLYASNQPVTVSHTWVLPNAPSQPYLVKVQATDQYGNSSDYSAPLSFIMTQNDAGSGGDAGSSASNALVLNSTLYTMMSYTFTGTLYHNDENLGRGDGADCYNFTVNNGDWMHMALTPLTNFSYLMILYDPYGNPVTPIGTNPIDMNATCSGNWTIAVLLNDNTYGQYSINLFVNLTLHWTIAVNYSPPEGVTITVDGQAHTLYRNYPITLTVTSGWHNITADYGFLVPIPPGDYYYVYLFTRWSDGSTANPRSVYLSQDWAVTAIYVRQRGIIM
jgi:hypothetical protein